METSSIQTNDLGEFLNLLDSPQDFLQGILLAPSSSSSSSNNNSHNNQHEAQVEALKLISKNLFSRVEKFAALYEKIDDKKHKVSINDDDDEEEEEEDSCPLSGLSELYTGPTDTEEGAMDKEEDDDDDDDDGAIDVDAETIFNQVDVQNSALLIQMKKIMKKLKKSVANSSNNKVGNNNVDGVIRLLNMDEMNSDDDDDADDHNAMLDENDSDESLKEEELEQEQGNDDENSQASDEDEETRRIRERMERSMAEMGDSDSDIDDEEDDNSHEEDMDGGSKTVNYQSDKKEEAIDQDREALYDGFFDLHEMEQMADEEEEMLPDEAYGAVEDDGKEDTLEKRKSMLPHARGRQGAEDNDDDDEDDEFNFLDKKVESTSRRKRYRDDEDIEALTGMYGDANDDSEGEDDDDDDVINMTAADFFGPPKKPSKDFLAKSKKSGKKVSFEDDDDSWDNHDFDEAGEDWRDADDEKDEGNNDAPTSQSNDDDDEEDIEHDESSHKEEDKIQTSNKLSNFAHRSKKLDEMTKQLEKDMLAEKPWQMVGEAKATQRPTNSLLEVTPTFEFATKMAPIITAEHTESIEEMIKRRILAEDWDDVIPRELPDIGLSKRNGELPEVSQERSKLSLGELYEREYLKKVAGYDADAVEKETEEEKVKNEMKMLFANLCSKLDALSNYHFAPRPVADEAEIRTSATPAVAMEEVLPLHVSDGQAMAPEEVYNKKKGRDGILRGESEMDQVSLFFVIISLLQERFLFLCYCFVHSQHLYHLYTKIERSQTFTASKEGCS